MWPFDFLVKIKIWFSFNPSWILLFTNSQVYLLAHIDVRSYSWIGYAKSKFRLILTYSTWPISFTYWHRPLIQIIKPYCVLLNVQKMLTILNKSSYSPGSFFHKINMILCKNGKLILNLSKPPPRTLKPHSKPPILNPQPPPQNLILKMCHFYLLCHLCHYYLCHFYRTPINTYQIWK